MSVHTNFRYSPVLPFLWFLVFLEVFPSIVIAQESQPAVKELLEIHKIELVGNHTFDDGTVKDVMQTKETPGVFPKLLFKVSEKLGSKPEYFEEEKFAADAKLLEDFYRDHGFYHTKVTEGSHIDSTGHTIDLSVEIVENVRSLVDTVDYRGLDSLSMDLLAELFKEPRIVRGMPYEESRAVAEISRVLDFLGNHGYPLAYFDRERSGKYEWKPTAAFRLTLTFVMGRKYQFGEASVHVDPPREDITDGIILRQLDFQPGEVYSREKKISSERNLNRLDLFEAVRVDNPRLSDTSLSSTVPIDVFVRPRARHELSPELSVSDENNAFNLGLGLGYTNRNFFGDARHSETHVRVRTQSIQEWNFHEVFGGRGFRDPTVVGAVELQFQVLQPYLFSRNLSGSWTTSISAEKQKPYILSILRNKIGLSNKFATYTFGLIDWTLERVSPEILGDTSDQATRTALSRDENQAQFNSIISATLQRDKTNDIFSPTDGFFNSITLGESGILPKLLPGIHTGLPFTQYYEVMLLGRWYQDLTSTRYNILAMKAKVGYQDKYGESRDLPVNIPLNRRFFAGGSGSVRGWRARDLGAMPDSLLQFGGNFILETNVEMRINYFRGYGKLGWVRLDNIWVVYFLDMGNVWTNATDFKPREIAMAAGVGLRYETFFGPFRVDYGFRVYDPKEVPGKQTVFQKRLFGDVLGNGVVQFGIGQAF
jgi:outer membrane protein insertion porin family